MGPQAPYWRSISQPGGDGRAIAALARRQGGRVARDQLLELGLGKKAIDYRARIGHLIVVYPGVYAVGHVPTLPIDRAKGAVLACGTGAVLSHGSATTLWGMARKWTFPLEVTVQRDRRPKGIRTHRSTALARADIKTHFGVRVTSPARTILDVAPRLNDRALARIVNDARLSNYLRLADLADVIERFPRHRGAQRLVPFLTAPNGPTRSEFEDAFLAFCDRFGLPTPQMNARVAGYEVDALFEAERVIVELDGYEFHADRASFENDRHRDAETLAHGFVTVRITPIRLTKHPETEARRLLTLLAKRR